MQRHQAQENSFDDGLSQLKDHIQKTLSSTTAFMIALVRNDLFEGKPRGHFSMLGAYDENSDSILVMDVAAHHGVWYWLDLEVLFMAMREKYPLQPDEGGYLIVS